MSRINERAHSLKPILFLFSLSRDPQLLDELRDALEERAQQIVDDEAGGRLAT